MGFFEQCVSAGPSYCMIANFSGASTTPQDLLEAFYTVLEDLIEKPRYLAEGAYTFAWDKDPPLSLYESIKTRVFQGLYEPAGWSYLARLLNATLSYDFEVYNLPLYVSNDTKYNEGVQALWGIQCSDGAFRAESPEDAIWLVEKQQNVSGFADVVQSSTWPCSQWKMSAAERYAGNFSVKTSFPILFTNGHYDPITPYASAVNMSAGFEGSVLLTHGGHGVSQPLRYDVHLILAIIRSYRAYLNLCVLTISLIARLVE